MNVSDPAQSTWFFNNDHWNNYLWYARTLYETSGLPIVLWQLPVGHINESRSVSAYTGNAFPSLTNTNTKYEDSSTPFFLGDSFDATSSLRKSYFSQNLYNDPELLVAGSAITWGDHMREVKEAGVISLLFGAGVGPSTDGIGDPPTDNYFWTQKVQEYYQRGPVPLDWSMFGGCSGSCPPNVSITYPADGQEIVQSSPSAVRIGLLAWDRDGSVSDITIAVDGQGIDVPVSGLVNETDWVPSDFGAYTLTATATDNDGRTTSATSTVTIVEFDPENCGPDLWDASAIYSAAGQRVAWNGGVYENLWWTQGNEPGTTSPDPWLYIGPCTAEANIE